MRCSTFYVFLALAICSLARSQQASAADLPSYGKSPGWVVPLYEWAGPYIGANIGYGLGRSSDNSSLSSVGTTLFTDSQVSNMNGVLGGDQIGYDVRMENWLAGLEADFQGTGQRSNHSYTCPAGVCAASAVSATFSEKLDFFGTVRARAGILATPSVLFYGTAGLAYGQIDSTSTLPGSLKQSSYKPGWTVGGGIESIVAGNWSVRLEYLYIDLGRDRGTDPSSVTSVVVTPLSFLTGGNTLVSGFNSHVTDNVVRIGFNYHWGGPAIGKY